MPAAVTACLVLLSMVAVAQDFSGKVRISDKEDNRADPAPIIQNDATTSTSTKATASSAKDDTIQKTSSVHSEAEEPTAFSLASSIRDEIEGSIIHDGNNDHEDAPSCHVAGGCDDEAESTVAASSHAQRLADAAARIAQQPKIRIKTLPWGPRTKRMVRC